MMLGQFDLRTCSSLAMANPPKNTPTYKKTKHIKKNKNLTKVYAKKPREMNQFYGI